MHMMIRLKMTSYEDAIRDYNHAKERFQQAHDQFVELQAKALEATAAYQTAADRGEANLHALRERAEWANTAADRANAAADRAKDVYLALRQRTPTVVSPTSSAAGEQLHPITIRSFLNEFMVLLGRGAKTGDREMALHDGDISAPLLNQCAGTDPGIPRDTPNTVGSYRLRNRYARPDAEREIG